jgi:molecular chaperone GrpE
MTKKFASKTEHGIPDGEISENFPDSEGAGKKSESDTDDPGKKVNPESFAGEEMIGELRRSLVDKEREADEYKDAMLRALADLENYKKRSLRERAEVRGATIGEIMENLFPILDNLELGVAAAEQHGSNQIVDGFKMILTGFKGLLSTYGVVEIFPLGEKFDARFHDCIRRAIDNKKENDTIVAVDRKGYKLNDKLLRPAIVAVSQHDEGELQSEQ